jgi:5-methyltetrahydrofolate--homocysteine methyltransferase
LELKAAIHGGQRAMGERGVKLPIMAQVTVDAFGKMQIFNTDILSVLTTVQGIGIDVFGINCSIGPDLMRATVKKLSRFCPVAISVVPNAGLPVAEAGKTVFKLTPEELAAHLAEFVSVYGVNIVGGCCGTRPDHIRAIAAAVKGRKPAARVPEKKLFVSGPQNAVELDSSSALIRIGERLNVRGSLKVRQAVEEAKKVKFDALEEVVNEQVRDLGVPVIDVCMDSNLVNTEDMLVRVIQEMTTDFSGAMCIDSFSVEALLRAVEVYPGRPILNSISLEEYAPGLDKIDAVVGPTRQHDPVYVALTTGPQGPAITAEDKRDLAKKIFVKCRDKYGIRADQLIVDVNAFPIGSESDERVNFAMESLRAIPLVKALHPDLKLSMGVGNLTNGLASRPYMRQVLTSVFVDEARKVGLDAAIINPNHYVPVSSLDPHDYALALKVIQNRDMEAFAELEEIAERKKGGPGVKKLAYDALGLEEAICAKIKDGFKQRQAGEARLADFTYTYQDTIVAQVATALQKHAPLDFVNRYLMAAMKELGDGFGRGEVSLPHLLKSADVMKHAMAFIEAFLHHQSGQDVHQQLSYKGVVVLGTVYQDVHSIGKDLVKTLLENYGYRVIDLGVQAPLQLFLDKAREHDACAIGMSALLVQTSNHMITVAKMLREQGLEHLHVLIGGAPVSYRHAAYVSMWGQGDPDKLIPNVFYCPSGMDGVNVMNQLLESPARCEGLMGENAAKLRWHYQQALRASAKEEELLKTLPRRKVAFTGRASQAKPFRLQVWRKTLAEIAAHLDVKTLFALHWNYGGHKSWAKKGVSEGSLKKQLAEWVRRCDASGWVSPAAACGLYPCYAEGDAVVLLDPSGGDEELTRIPFSVVIGGKKEDVFSLAQYFRGREAGGRDLIGIQITTGGAAADVQVQKFKDEGDMASALLLQGLSDRVAEDMAQIAHDHLRGLVGVPAKVGVRYSPGYPGLKEIHVNRTIFELLGASKHLGISLTAAAEFSPTGTTAAVVCFHPQAGYE